MSEENNELVKTDEQNNAMIQATPQNEFSVRQYKSMWNDKDLLSQAYNCATYLSKSALVPESYMNKPENCLIALDLANRSGMSPLTIMQNLFIVKQKPAWSGQFAIALVNASGRFSRPLKPIFVGEKGTLNYGCYMTTVNLLGETINGSTITMQMAKDEGWIDKAGSKWKTMPEQMLMYRAGAFFARVHCPDVLYGLQTMEEVKDVNGYEDEEKQKVKIVID